ncbi:PhzF family phenazine biosynthesis protein [Salinivirga cyanobacteriivorans]
MESIAIYQVDAFTDKLFGGNPAAVCVLEETISGELMQKIAMENNLSETAFVTSNGNEFNIRYFAPKMEIDLCGHASLASAFVLDKFYLKNTSEIVFHTYSVGDISVSVKDDMYALNLPKDEIKEAYKMSEQISEILGAVPVELYKGTTDLMAIFDNEDQIQRLNPDFTELLKLDIRGLIVTAPGNNSDIVCRFFCPAIGVNEDPVTGSAHTTLVPYWTKKLGKSNFVSHQLSERGGELLCRDLGDRVEVAGKAALYMKGELNV